jgi:hypothetical protein
VDKETYMLTCCTDCRQPDITPADGFGGHREEVPGLGAQWESERRERDQRKERLQYACLKLYLTGKSQSIKHKNFLYITAIQRRILGADIYFFNYLAAI